MPTSVHIPKPLLLAVDRRAHTLNISRNRLIVRALEREVSEAGSWSGGFFERLAAPDPELAETADEMLEGIQQHRRSKRPPSL